jgi:hypothetical protein
MKSKATRLPVHQANDVVTVRGWRVLSCAEDLADARRRVYEFERRSAELAAERHERHQEALSRLADLGGAVLMPEQARRD